MRGKGGREELGDHRLAPTARNLHCRHLEADAASEA